MFDIPRCSVNNLPTALPGTPSGDQLVYTMYLDAIAAAMVQRENAYGVHPHDLPLARSTVLAALADLWIVSRQFCYVVEHTPQPVSTDDTQKTFSLNLGELGIVINWTQRTDKIPHILDRILSRCVYEASFAVGPDWDPARTFFVVVSMQLDKHLLNYAKGDPHA